jgi:hypothetical protein
MLVRFVRPPLLAVVALAVGLLSGSALLPVAAQQQSGLDGQVAVRSDGSVYLISGGQRRWVATVSITDAEINAYPEGEPIYGGLAPLGQQSASPSPVASPRPAVSAPVAPPSTTTAPLPSVPNPGAQAAPGSMLPAASAPAGASDQSLPVDIDIDGSPKFEAGDVIKLAVKTEVGATCDLTVRYPDGAEAAQPATAADGRGHCNYDINIPGNVPAGTGSLRAAAHVAGRSNQGEATFEIVPNS